MTVCCVFRPERDRPDSEECAAVPSCCRIAIAFVDNHLLSILFQLNITCTYLCVVIHMLSEDKPYECALVTQFDQVAKKMFDV